MSCFGKFGKTPGCRDCKVRMSCRRSTVITRKRIKKVQNYQQFRSKLLSFITCSMIPLSTTRIVNSVRNWKSCKAGKKTILIFLNQLKKDGLIQMHIVGKATYWLGSSDFLENQKFI